MTRAKGFSLVPKTVPLRQRTNFYQEIVEEFVASREKSVVVEGTERKPATLIQGLRKAVTATGRDNIKVVQRMGDTYLIKV
ncbi:MAG TPA: hypothetical protein VFD74_02685 [Thermoleophilia bacterium]|nr:hypothetical protein [Thermoleophilia bacterium]